METMGIKKFIESMGIADFAVSEVLERNKSYEWMDAFSKNSGIAIGARLIKSASKPLSNKQLQRVKEEQRREDGKS